MLAIIHCTRLDIGQMDVLSYLGMLVLHFVFVICLVIITPTYYDPQSAEYKISWTREHKLTDRVVSVKLINTRFHCIDIGDGELSKLSMTRLPLGLVKFLISRLICIYSPKIESGQNVHYYYLLRLKIKLFKYATKFWYQDRDEEAQVITKF